MKRLVAISAGVIVSAAIALPTFAVARGQPSKQHAQAGGWVVCREQLLPHSNPPLRPSPHAARFTITGVLDSCTSSDPTVDRGIVSINDTSSDASCTRGGSYKGVGAIRWNNGKVTRIQERHGVFGVGGISMGRGDVSAGTEFVGGPFIALDELVINQAVLQLCGSPVGLGVFLSNGEIRIGHVSLNGAAFNP